LEGLIGTALDTEQITIHGYEILRLATSIQQGTVTAPLMLRKLGAQPRRNGLALALRELGRLERSRDALLSPAPGPITRPVAGGSRVARPWKVSLPGGTA
jgi:TnpA family transposase